MAGEGRERPGRRETPPADESTSDPSEQGDDEGDESGNAAYPDGDEDTGDEAGDASASPPAEAGLVPSGAPQRPAQHAASQAEQPTEPVLRILPLGSGLVLIGLGLGLAFIGLRLRRS